MGYLLQRLNEASTHAGLAALMSLLRVVFPGWATVFDALIGLFGALAVAIPSSLHQTISGALPAISGPLTTNSTQTVTQVPTRQEAASTLPDLQA